MATKMDAGLGLNGPLARQGLGNTLGKFFPIGVQHRKWDL
jgi:hypothetical protein